MRALEPEWLWRQTVDLKMADQLREIGEHKGRAELYGVHALKAMDSLRRITAEHSAAAACRLERSETSIEQANYEQVVFTTQDSAHKLSVEAVTILNFHTGLFRDSGITSAGFQSTAAADAMDELCRNYLALESSTEPLLLIGAVLLELLRIQPFAAGNRRVALLTSLWLMNRRGFTVNRFVSVERILEIKQKEFQNALRWIDAEKPGSSSREISLWWGCWLEILLQAYRELSARVEALGGRRGVKTELVLAWIDAESDDFSIRQIQQQIPECGIELIRKIIKEQKTAGRIICLGRGPHSLWRKKKARRGRNV
ncbi:MAG: Fic family protein [Negativicutes bacterium]